MSGIDLPATLDRRDNLPGLMARAGQRLLDARNSAEVLEAKHLAEAALHYAKVTQAANDTHADCLRIITRAEMRMANEIDRGQAAGEVRTRADNQHTQGSGKLNLDEAGIDSRRLSEWREVRDAGPEAVEQAIQTALDEGRAPTKGDIRAHVRGTFGTGDNEWYTPDRVLDTARLVLGEIDLDPASSDHAQKSVRAARYFTKDDDGLTKEWNGRIWLNPPYAQPFISQFVGKMVAERQAGRVTAALMLTHNYTDTSWFHQAAAVADAICFTRGRVSFVDPNGKYAAPTQGQAFFYFGNDLARFAAEFASAGLIVSRVGVADGS